MKTCRFIIWVWGNSNVGFAFAYLKRKWTCGGLGKLIVDLIFSEYTEKKRGKICNTINYYGSDGGLILA